MTTPLQQTVKLGIFFFFIFTAYTSYQTIITFIYQNQNLSSAGPLNFITNYLAFIVSNLFAPKCKLSFKTQMIIGSLGHGFNVATGIFIPYIENQGLKYTFIGFGGIVAGAVAGFMWVSQGGYLREVIKYQSDKGKYTGIFQLLYSLSSLAAGFITTFFLGFFSNQVYFIALTISSALAGIFAFLFFQDIKQQHSDNNQISNTSIFDDLKASFKFYPRMLPILIMLALDSVVLGMYGNQVIRLMPQEEDNDIRNRLAGVITIFIGLGSIVGGFLGGIISDKFGLLKTGRFVLGFYFVSAVFTFVAIYANMYEMACFIGFMWGCAYYFFEAWINVAILKLYDGKLEAFSVNKQVHSITIVLFQVVILATNNKIDLKILVPIIAFLALPALWSINKANYQKQNIKNLIESSLPTIDIDSPTTGDHYTKTSSE